jgi:hypothetical protein
MSEELKNCPFCGGGAYKVEECDDVLSGCDKCEAYTWEDKWNTRANEYNPETHILIAKADVPEDLDVAIGTLEYIASPERLKDHLKEQYDKVVKTIKLIADKMEG